MSKVITFSRKYPPYHSKAGENTFFVEKFWNSSFRDCNYYELCHLNKKQGDVVLNLLDTFFQEIKKYGCKDFAQLKNTTIRAGNRFKKGDYFSPRVWGTDINPKSGRSGPYHSKQIIIGPDTLIHECYNFQINGSFFKVNDKTFHGETESNFELLELIAKNDGLTRHDLLEWFKYPKPFTGQIIVYHESVKY